MLADWSSPASAEEVAAAARKMASCPAGPLPLPKVCDAAMMRVLPGRLVVGERRHTAMLVPTADGFHALVDEALLRDSEEGPAGRRRLRFVLAHELGHTFFYRPGRPPTRRHPPDHQEEQFCQRFATALLVPPSAAGQASLTPDGLRALADDYDVPRQTAAWAIARARPDVSVLWLRPAPDPKRGEKETMRVQWGASVDRCIAENESFKSPLADLAPHEHSSSTELVRLAGWADWLRIDAWRFARSMLVVVRPTDGSRALNRTRSQLELF